MSEQTPREILNDLVATHFNHGDPAFYDITSDELDLYNRKNKDYAGGGNDPNGNFNRVANFWSMYPGISLSDPRVVALSHAMKQVDQICWSLSRGYEGEVEGLDPRFADVHIYFKIARVINRGIAKAAAEAKLEATAAPKGFHIILEEEQNILPPCVCGCSDVISDDDEYDINGERLS
jgi:hypothetical protein